MTKNPLEERAIQRFQRENKEQLQTIEKLTNALEISQLLFFLSNNQYELTSSSKIKLLNNYSVSQNSLQHQQNLQRIAELEEELQMKKNNYQKLEKQICDYNANAAKFEELLEQNEKEKAELLLQFQEGSSSPNSKVNRSLTLEDLDDKINEKQQEFEKLKMRTKETKEKCEKLRSQLESSYNYSKLLQKQLNESQHYEYNEPPRIKYQNNKEAIENLKKQIDRANKKIKSLTDDNDMLNKLLESDNDYEMAAGSSDEVSSEEM